MHFCFLWDLTKVPIAIQLVVWCWSLLINHEKTLALLERIYLLIIRLRVIITLLACAGSFFYHRTDWRELDCKWLLKGILGQSSTFLGQINCLLTTCLNQEKELNWKLEIVEASKPIASVMSYLLYTMNMTLPLVFTSKKNKKTMHVL